MLVFAVGSSYVERMFSKVSAILTPQRNRLATDYLEMLVLLSMSGPRMEEFGFDNFTKWLSDNKYDFN